GIRDFHVTGVQTCALPIFVWIVSFALMLAVPKLMFSLAPVMDLAYVLVLMALGFLLMPLLLRAGVSRSLDLGGGFRFAREFFARSEERRVGKEGISRGVWW